jgi:hypothetical protein
MKNKNILLTLALGALSVLSCQVYAQDRSEMSKREITRMDSLETVSQKEIQAQKTKDENTMADFKHDRKQTKAKAKDAQRVERDANAAARESRAALRAEKKAQKSRKDANRQAEKASDARDKSDKN